MKTRTYSELRRLPTFPERLAYLRLHGTVGDATFGFDRWINQNFYTSSIWKRVREEVILRDSGCDLGVTGYDIFTNLLVHHMNPVTVDDIIHSEEWIVDPEFLITTTIRTHNDIHYGRVSPTTPAVVERLPGDTRLW